MLFVFYVALNVLVVYVTFIVLSNGQSFVKVVQVKGLFQEFSLINQETLFKKFIPLLLQIICHIYQSINEFIKSVFKYLNKTSHRPEK